MSEKWQVRAYAHGRTELAGNHVDHQGGIILAATIDCGCEMLVRTNGSSKVHIQCEVFPDVLFDLDKPDALEPHEEEKLSTQALIRGCIAQVAAYGIPVRGFDAQLTSTVPAGDGLSSSAAVELACICALDALFGNNAIPEIERAKMAKAAECDFFGKPCGLMDQCAIACGGIVAIDFFDENTPVVEHIDADFSSNGWDMLLVDTLAEHCNENDAFSQIPYDMQYVARHFGKQRLEDLGRTTFLKHITDIRSACGDRATLRALHYFNETALVRERIQALKERDFERFVALTQRSSASSAQYLQNLSVAGAPDQSAMVALALADIALDGCGSCRIHGGGFGGKIQIILPATQTETFINRMESMLEPGCCQPIRIVDEKACAKWM